MAKVLTTSYQKIASKDWTFVYNGTTMYVGLRVYAKYNSQNKTTKRTYVSYKSTFVVTAPTLSVGVSSATAKLDGTTKNYSSYTSFSRGETTLQEITSNKYIEHNDDGTSKTKTLSASWSATITGNASISGDILAPKMDLYPMISNVSDITDESSSATVTTTYASTYEEMTCSIAIFDANDRSHIEDGQATPIVAYKPVTISSDTTTYTLTSADNTALANAVTSGTSKTLTFALKSISGNNTPKFSLYDKNMTLVNALPTFGTSTNTETNTSVIAITGSQTASSVIKNASIVQVSIPVSGQKGANISSVVATHLGNTYQTTSSQSPYVFTIPIGAFSEANATISLVATDTRGNPNNAQITIPAINYIPVTINTSDAVIKRVSATSDNVTISLTGTYLNSIGSYANDSYSSITWEAKNEGGTVVASGTLTRGTNYTITNNVLTISNVIVDSNVSYDDAGTFTIRITDRLSTVGQSVQIPPGVPLFDYGKTNFEINGDLYIADRGRNNPVNVLSTINSLMGDVADLSTAVSNIIESGYVSSGNTGYYIKFADGTMITRHTAEGNAKITTTWGNGYTTGANNTISLGNFPVAFLSGSTPYVWITAVRDGNNFWLGTCNGTNATTAGVISLLRFTSSTTSYKLRILAIGRWK